jgi:hypothetical protein
MPLYLAMLEGDVLLKALHGSRNRYLVHLQKQTVHLPRLS